MPVAHLDGCDANAHVRPLMAAPATNAGSRKTLFREGQVIDYDPRYISYPTPQQQMLAIILPLMAMGTATEIRFDKRIREVYLGV
jgi:hypothetical protein